mmetsp:Transcript_53050/g.164131  ORF Transcript_53050/g.164131 Transcript_53050/m.164131 type:complete len:206 (-) Transcript_53050:608-1225(-)
MHRQVQAAHHAAGQGHGPQRHQPAGHLLQGPRPAPRLRHRRLGRHLQRPAGAGHAGRPALQAHALAPPALRRRGRQLRAAERRPRDAREEHPKQAGLRAQRGGQLLLGRRPREVRGPALHRGRPRGPVDLRLREDLRRRGPRGQAVAGRAGEPRLRRLPLHARLGPGHRLHVGQHTDEHWPLGDARALLELEGAVRRLLRRLLLC